MRKMSFVCLWLVLMGAACGTAATTPVPTTAPSGSNPVPTVAVAQVAPTTAPAIAPAAATANVEYTSPEGEHVLGKADAKVTLVDYSDFL